MQNWKSAHHIFCSGWITSWQIDGDDVPFQIQENNDETDATTNSYERPQKSFDGGQVLTCGSLRTRLLVVDLGRRRRLSLASLPFANFVLRVVRC